MSISQLQQAVERHFAAGPAAVGDQSAMDDFLELRAALESGQARAASPDAASTTGWRVNAWVKQGILLGFRLGALVDCSAAGLSFIDKLTFPVHRFAVADEMCIRDSNSSLNSGIRLTPNSLDASPSKNVNVDNFAEVISYNLLPPHHVSKL